MSKLGRRFAIGSVLAALAVLAWTGLNAWRARDRARADAWMAYCRGGLSQLLEGSSRGRELLAGSLKKPLSPAQKKELAGHAALVATAAKSAEANAAASAGDPFFEPLREGLRWHAELAEAASDWTRIAGKRDLVEAALGAEAGMRQSLGGALDQQRERIFGLGRIGKERGLEINALLYSLKE